MGKILMILGSIIFFTGLILSLSGNLFSWFGRLPGDIRIEKENFRSLLCTNSQHATYQRCFKHCNKYHYQNFWQALKKTGNPLIESPCFYFV